MRDWLAPVEDDSPSGAEVVVVSRNLTTVQVTCLDCRGTGRVHSPNMQSLVMLPCMYCMGKGWVVR